MVTEVAALRNVVNPAPHAIDLDGGFDVVWHGRL